jgi:hypothetical protein
MHRHRRGSATVAAAPGESSRLWLEILRAQIKEVDQEIVRGRPSGRGLRDEMARVIADMEDRLDGVPLRLRCDRARSPAAWIDSILAAAELRSLGVVERHLVGATLQQRHPDITIPNNPGHAGDAQTGRSGDFPLKDVSYHVTATDGKEATERCKQNIESGVHPVLLVPRRYLEKARARADVVGIEHRVSILAIEDFITQNIIEMSTHQERDFFSTLKAIIDEYNRRLEEVETDMSLKIELL